MTDEIDREARGAQSRLEQALRELQERGVPASGHVDDEGDPMQAILDGLREFPANEVVLIPGVERGWREAELLAARIRREVGVP